jgi:DNA polymerase-4
MSDTPGFCRDCFADLPQRHGNQSGNRCGACGSPRLLAHSELPQLAIAHIDCDAFYAAVEKRDNPELRDKPLIVGGGKRGVVSTCCYIARTYGVRSAMPMFKALAACPDAVVLRPDMAKYATVGREIRKLMMQLTPLVEPLSVDEAFLDLSGTEALHAMSPALTLARFARYVETEIGITVSIGLSYCKFLAKIASDHDKPRGFAVIGRAEAKAFLAAKPTGLIWGVGRVAQERLARDGFRQIGDLQRREENELMRLYGQEGRRLWRLAQGQDERRVEPEHAAKSISAETTFEHDLGTAEDLVPILYRLSERVAARLKRAELSSRAVTLKMKTGDFKIRTRSRAGFAATQLSGRLFAAARDLLLPELDGTKYRLIGLAAGDLCPAAQADQGDLVDAGVVREKATETAIDTLRAKFGPTAVVKGITFRGKP